MTYTYKDLINDFEAFNIYVESLRGMDKGDFFTPIAPGKWSTAEIMSHISFWDQYIREGTLPQMTLNAIIESIDFDILNNKAATYALSGLTQDQLLDKQIKERSELVQELRNKTENEFFEKFIVNGDEIDPHSGYPHTIFNYIAGFSWHDNHHKAQIEAFRKKVSSK